jgi:pantoate--beta-alanine ligase
MINIYDIKVLKERIKQYKDKGLSVGFVPTMGYLHKGHLSLIQKAKQQNDRVVVSIFVNPLQFGPNEDFDKYPKDMARDLILCESEGADIVFTPTVGEMYKSKSLVYVDVLELGDTLCGARRQGHFKGVCTVVSKLFNIVTPDRAYFGQKDAQQLVIIKKMAEDMNFDIEIIGCPIVREFDGLAMSSRNTYLTKEERIEALVLNKSLEQAKELIISGQRDAEKIKTVIKDIIAKSIVIIDYVEIVDTNTLKPLKKINNEALVCVAAYVGKTRLIDNLLFKED